MFNDEERAELIFNYLQGVDTAIVNQPGGLQDYLSNLFDDDALHNLFFDLMGIPETLPFPCAANKTGACDCEWADFAGGNLYDVLHEKDFAAAKAGCEEFMANWRACAEQGIKPQEEDDDDMASTPRCATCEYYVRDRCRVSFLVPAEGGPNRIDIKTTPESTACQVYQPPE